MSGSETDRRWMERALELAAFGGAATQPNPMVGAVLVSDGRIIGEGWHAGPGQAHAEQQAISAAAEPVSGATLYVSLEPCHLHGRTPPCTDAIIAAGIERVVYASQDPNPTEQGRSHLLLEAAGLQVEAGLLSEEAATLNEIYFHLQQRDRPYVMLKSAVTLNGRIARADGSSRWITGEASRREVHRFRAAVAGVAVGGMTAKLDRPKLDLRMIGDADRLPRPVVFDGDPPCCPADLEWEERKPILLVPDGADRSADHFRERGWSVIGVPKAKAGGLAIGESLSALSEAGISSLLVEGGGRLQSAFLKAGLWDRWELFIAPKLFPSDGKPVWTEQLEMDGIAIANSQQRGEDIQLTLRPAEKG